MITCNYKQKDMCLSSSKTRANVSLGGACLGLDKCIVWKESKTWTDKQKK